jgi:ferric iron reductase protein FhuF
MLNNRKIRIMTKLATYEEKEGKEDIKLSKYYKADYVRLNVLKTVMSATFGYLFLLIIIAVYSSEYLIENAVTLDYKGIFNTILGYYLIILTVMLVGALIGYSIKYDKSRKQLSQYFRMLKRLRTIYREEDEGTVMDSQREDTLL